MPLRVGKPADFTVDERATFVAFVAAAGEVDPVPLAGLIDRARTLIALDDGSAVIATAAIKTPNAGYRTGVFAKAGVPLLAAAHPLELGWVHVHPEHRRQGHAARLVAEALRAAEGSGVYATTRSAAMRTILERVGFVVSGEPYASVQAPGAALTLHCLAPA